MNPLLDQKNTPLMRCRDELKKTKYTLERLVALDVHKVAEHYGMPVDHARFEQERAITERGGKPWELLKRKE